MAVINRIGDFHADMTAWRRDIHKHPETAFEEQRTSDFVAGKLAEFGLEVHRGLAGTGVVGLLAGKQDNGRFIGLRADMDALHIHELNDFGHSSVHDGKMHACGHDGHTTMLLGAARYLAETRNFDGRLAFIFQPAEENEGGADVMIREGLFDQFPVEEVYGLHNWPGLPVGEIAMRPGPAMAAFDIFEMTVTGRGGHAAMPHQGIDPIVVAAQIVTALQTIPSRRTNPVDAVTVSVTQFHAGDTWNVIPEEAVIRGTTRCFRKEVQDQIEADIARIAEGICASQGAKMTLSYERRYPALVNSERESEVAAEDAAKIVGGEKVTRNASPIMGSEDFAFMLNARPGCYVLLGNAGADGRGGVPVHNPHYDFNDEALVIGASYWARLAETALSGA